MLLMMPSPLPPSPQEIEDGDVTDLASVLTRRNGNHVYSRHHGLSLSYPILRTKVV